MMLLPFRRACRRRSRASNAQSARLVLGVLVPLLLASVTPLAATEALGDGSVAAGLCQEIGARLGSVSVESCLAADLSATGARTIEGTPLLMREFPPLEEREPLGRVLLLGGIHGDELTSVSIVFRWIEVLQRYHSGMFHWRVVPLLNPDGLLGREPRRTNANGVDLNRNFPCPDWREATQDYWVRRTGKNPRRYPGLRETSENETQWVVSQVNEFQPDVIVSVHAPWSVLDFDGPPDPPDKLGPLRLKLLGTYPGSLGRWAGVSRQIPVITLELPNAGIMPSDADQWAIWRDLVSWLRRELRSRPPSVVASR